ncbi:hypothetical protein ABZX12_18510 [Kribbella sp. NPDC003505]|uniref:hypothetical protein n=1 Tax=Kribbella sp. NPDC003505 TaxID=3154448 RepID=UPI0033AD0369
MEVRTLSRDEVAELNAVLDPRMIRRTQAVQAAYAIAGVVAQGEVFTSDVLDVAAFLLVDDAIVCGFQWRDGKDQRECCLGDGHADQGSWHVDRDGTQYNEVPF